MRIAMPVWNERVSPLFDAAGRIRVLSVIDGFEQYRFEADVIDLNLPRICMFLKHMKIDVLICGAISEEYLHAIRESGIRVIADISGGIDDIVTAYGEDRLGGGEYHLPGPYRHAKQAKR